MRKKILKFYFYISQAEIQKKHAGLFLFLLCFFCISWKWKDFSIKLDSPAEIKIETDWTIDTVSKGALRPYLVNNSPPLIVDNLVIQGNAIDGIKAYDKKSARLIWSLSIPSGVSGPPALHKGNIYFGGADGFFYSLQAKTGLLNWKYFSAEENFGEPLIFDNIIYWQSAQKVYAVNIKGSLLWIYSDSSPRADFLIKGASRPAIYKDNLYVGFQTGALAALNRKTGQLKRKRSFSSAIIEPLKLKGKCLFVPVFDSHLFCLNFFNKKLLWKLKGGSAVQWGGEKNIYQFYKGWLYAFKDRKLKWKKQLAADYIFPAALVKNYLIYGSPSKGEITILQSKDGRYIEKYKFGTGLAGPLTVQGSDIYFLSTSAHLRKLKLKFK